VADPDAASRFHLTHDAFKPLEVEAAIGLAVVRPERLDGGGAAGVAAEVGERVAQLAVLEVPDRLRSKNSKAALISSSRAAWCEESSS